MLKYIAVLSTNENNAKLSPRHIKNDGLKTNYMAPDGNAAL